MRTTTLHGGLRAVALVLIPALVSMVIVSAAGADEATDPAAPAAQEGALAADSAAAASGDVAGPTLTCSMRSLPIMAAEVAGARITCQVAGASGDDTTFTMQVTRLPDALSAEGGTTTTLCSGTLTSGAGTCMANHIDRSSASLGQLALDGTLQPSGTLLRSVAGLSPPVSPAPAMQFQPLPQP